MPSQPPIPPLLSNHFAVPPESSLTLLTSVLGASSNWLVLRFLYSAQISRKGPDATLVSDSEAKVVLVSWLRDWSFWKEGAKRLGVDLTKSSFVTFFDGLGTGFGLHEGGIEQVEGKILDATRKLKNEGSKVLVILDGIDLLLAATKTSVGEIVDCVGELREHAAIVLTLSADAPLLHTRHTPLEVNHASLVMNLAHQARLVLGVRDLDTGVARDVSGVVRIGRGGGSEGAEGLEEKELLYFVAGDGGVRVFGRGA
ncbi:MAG: hypothetical protein Q9195_000908 [Heterodermia aff. obscurata]